MIYYVPLLMIDDFEYNIIEKFDKLLQDSAKGKNKKLTPMYISNKLSISELSAIKLLSKSEKFGLVKLEYTIKCKNCGKIIKVNFPNVGNSMFCKHCNLIKKFESVKNIYFYYSVLIR